MFLILAELNSDVSRVIRSVGEAVGLESIAGIALLRRLHPMDVDVLVMGGYRLVIYASEGFLRLCRDGTCAWRGVMLVYEG